MKHYGKEFKVIRCIAIQIMMLAFIMQIILPLFTTVYATATVPKIEDTSGYTQEQWIQEVIKRTAGQAKQQTTPCNKINMQYEIGCKEAIDCEVGQPGAGWETCCGCPGSPVCEAYHYCRFGICKEGTTTKERLRQQFYKKIKISPPFEYKDEQTKKKFAPSFSECVVVPRGTENNIKHPEGGLHAGCITHVFRCNYCNYWFYHHVHVEPLPNPPKDIRVEKWTGQSLAIVWDRNLNPENTTEYAVKINDDDNTKKSVFKCEFPFTPNKNMNSDKNYKISIKSRHPNKKWDKDFVHFILEPLTIDAEIKYKNGRDYFLPGEEAEFKVNIGGYCHHVDAEFNKEKKNIPYSYKTTIEGEKVTHGKYEGKIKIHNDMPDGEYNIHFATVALCYKDPTPNRTLKIKVQSDVDVNGNVVSIETANKLLGLPKDHSLTLEHFEDANQTQLDKIITEGLPEVPVGEQMVVIGKLHNAQYTTTSGNLLYSNDEDNDAKYRNFQKQVQSYEKDSYYVSIIDSPQVPPYEHIMFFKGTLSNGKSKVVSRPYKLIEKELDIGVNGAVISLETAKKEFVIAKDKFAITIEDIDNASYEQLEGVIKRTEIDKIQIGEKMVVIGKLYNPEPTMGGTVKYLDGAENGKEYHGFERKIEEKGKESYYASIIVSAGKEAKQYLMHFEGTVGKNRKEASKPYELIVLNAVAPRIEKGPGTSLEIVWDDTNSHLQGVIYEVEMNYSELGKISGCRIAIPEKSIFPNVNNIARVTPIYPPTGDMGPTGSVEMPPVTISPTILYPSCGYFLPGQIANCFVQVGGYSSVIQIKYDNRLFQSSDEGIISHPSVIPPATPPPYPGSKRIKADAADGIYKITFSAIASCYIDEPKAEKEIRVGTVIEVDGNVISYDVATTIPGGFSCPSLSGWEALLTIGPNRIKQGEQMVVIGKLYNPQHPTLEGKLEYKNDNGSYGGFSSCRNYGQYTYGYSIMTAQELGPHTMNFKGTLIPTGKTREKIRNYEIVDEEIIIIPDPEDPQENFSGTIHYDLQIGEPTWSNDDIHIREKSGYAIPISKELNIDTKLMKTIKRINEETHEEEIYGPIETNDYILESVRILNHNGVSCYVVPRGQMTSHLQAGNISWQITPEQCVKLIEKQKPSAKNGVFDFEPAHSIRMECPDPQVRYHSAKLTLQLPINEKYGPKRQRAIYFDPNAPDGTYSVIIEVASQVEFKYEADGQTHTKTEEIKQFVVIEDAIIIEESMYIDDRTVQK